MRSVLVHLRDAAEAEVTAFLSRRYPSPEPGSWVLTQKDDPVLYVSIYRDMNTEFEVEQWFALVECLGAEPSVSVAADVSGRHPGDEQVREFVCSLLAAFDGVTQDDYTGHCWTLPEIESGAQAEGHPYFA